MADALIWGASGGIGSALVTLLKENGWRVFAVARHEERIPDVADHTYHFDAGDPYSYDKVAMLVAQETEALDLIVYAAGGVLPNPLEKLDPEAWMETLNANLTGAFLAAHSGLTALKKEGHMMFISAYVQKITLPRMGAYTTAKAGLETMFTILQKENRKRNLTIVRPPAVDTPFWENAPFKLPDSAIQPEDVANAILEQYNADKSGELNL